MNVRQTRLKSMGGGKKEGRTANLETFWIPYLLYIFCLRRRTKANWHKVETFPFWRQCVILIKSNHVCRLKKQINVSFISKDCVEVIPIMCLFHTKKKYNSLISELRLPVWSHLFFVSIFLRFMVVKSGGNYSCQNQSYRNWTESCFSIIHGSPTVS